ncbi:MAG: hypothetical protein ABR915_16110 [Thermoguttaceae bacterium]
MTLARLRSDVCDVVVFYPTPVLARQIRDWSGRHRDRRVETATGRSAREIREAVDRAEVVLVDATEDHVQAIDALVMASGGHGPGKAAVYTERIHEGLELFVRQQGVPLLFGPLTGAQWEGFFERIVPGRHGRQPWKLVA